MNEGITYTEYKTLMKRIGAWLLKNNAKFTKRDVYTYFKQSLKRADLENVIKNDKAGYDGLICEYVECAIHDNAKNLGFLPNYVTRKNKELIYKNEYVDMANRVNAYETLHKVSPAVVYRSVQSSKETWDLFCKAFGTPTTIDGALTKIKNLGYAYYYNSIYSNETAINRMKNKKGVNCTDSAQVLYRIGQGLDYTVQFVHVMCKKSGGHVRLRFKHPKHTGGKWINRDPACVLNGGAVTSIWCADGNVVAYDPKWLFTDLEK